MGEGLWILKRSTKFIFLNIHINITHILHYVLFMKTCYCFFFLLVDYNLFCSHDSLSRLSTKNFFHDYQNQLKETHNNHYVYLYTDAGMIRDDTTVRALEATERDLLVVHTKGYLNNLKVSPCRENINSVIDS